MIWVSADAVWIALGVSLQPTAPPSDTSLLVCNVHKVANGLKYLSTMMQDVDLSLPPVAINCTST